MFIKHVKFIDVCIEVQTIQKDKNSCYVHGTFWNLGAVESYPIGEAIKITISLDKLADWQQLTDLPSTKTLRTANWQPFSC